jgi:AAHS family benzoate transporter-like MFS transporter
MPNVVAQMTEYSPRKMRSTLVTLMFSGYSVGGILAAILGKALLERHGWHSVFLAAGVPVVLIPFILRAMPESMPFLVRKERTDALQAIVARLRPDHQREPGDRYVVHREAAGSGRMHHLLGEGRAFSTSMFWVAFFMCLFMVYALSSWLTKLMAQAGYSLGSALTFVLVLNAGAMVGAIGGGWLADKLHIKWVLVGMYVLAAVSITLLGQPLPTAALFVVVALAGASTIGTQIVTYAYVGQFYPATIRSTGIGWASGVGRSGAILAPIVIGYLVSLKLPLGQNFLAMAVPAVIATLAISLIDHRRSASGRREQPGREAGEGAVATAQGG